MRREFLVNRIWDGLIPSLIVCVLSNFYGGVMAANNDERGRELGKIKSKWLEEISGMAASRKYPDTFWVQNDGESGLLYAINSSGKLIAFVSCSIKLKDLEDIAIGPGPRAGADFIYLGDIGDNDRERREIGVVRFVEPELSGERGEQIDVDEAEEFRLAYPDGPHDAEALFVDPKTGELFIVTKEKQRARLYSISADRLKDGDSSKLRAAGTLDVDEVSAGAISPDGRRIILRREARGWLWKRDGNESVPEALRRKPETIPVLGKRQGPNGEAICFGPDSNSYFTVSEGDKQPLYEFALPSSAAGKR
jgi:hypothetical protein